MNDAVFEIGLPGDNEAEAAIPVSQVNLGVQFEWRFAMVIDDRTQQLARQTSSPPCRVGHHTADPECPGNSGIIEYPQVGRYL